MNKITLATAALIMVILAIEQSSARPQELPPSELEPPKTHIRVRRFTCDVLSFEAKGIKVNDAACGAHCLLRGRTGGYCNAKRVCICR